ncbi:MAG: Cna B-type domain-containing protein, partial [Erysipelotrichaceae bacterium]|nr:Cna B-type domain-containing protein [Erysipelotrichaceae bacterium]
MKKKTRNKLFGFIKIILSLVLAISLLNVSGFTTYATEVADDEDIEEIVETEEENLDETDENEEEVAEDEEVNEETSEKLEATEEETIEEAEVNEPVTYTATASSVKVTVEASSNALPENAELVVTLFDENSDEYNEASNAIDLDDDLSMAALDISFMVNGEEVEPTEEVKVTIDASAIIPTDADESTIEVQHLEESGGSITSELVADAQNGSEGTISDSVAEFTVESFSTFTITWSTSSTGGGPGEQQSSSLSINTTTYLVGTTTEISNSISSIIATSGDTIGLTSSNSALDISGYTLTSATITNGNTTVTATGVTVTMSTSSDGGNRTTTYAVTYTDSNSESQTLVSSTTSAPSISISLYYTPNASLTLSASNTTLTASKVNTTYYDYSDITWTISNSNVATLSTTTGDSTTLSWVDGTVAGTTVTVTATSTATGKSVMSGTTKTATASYTFTYASDAYITISEDSGNDTDGYTLSATTDSTYDYDTDDNGIVNVTWSLSNNNATFTTSDDNTIVVKWNDSASLSAGDTVTVTAIATTEDGKIKVVDTYTLTYGKVDTTISVKYGTSSSNSNASGATIVLRDSDDNTVATGTTNSSGNVTLTVLPGTYTVVGYYSSGSTVYECETTITIDSDGSVTYEDKGSYVLLKASSAYEHIDIKDVMASTDGADASNEISSIDSVVVYDLSGNTVYTSNTISYASATHNWQTHYGTSDTHSISFYDTYTVVISYTLDDGTSGTLTIDSTTVYPTGTTYPGDGANASKLRTYLGIDSNSTADIDISGMSLYLVASILCDSSSVSQGSVTGTAGSNNTYKNWGLDFALSVAVIKALTADVTLNFTKEYTNAGSLEAGKFSFSLYEATVSNSVWSFGDTAYDTITNGAGSYDSTSNSYKVTLSFDVSDTDGTYYYVIQENDTGYADTTYDSSIYGVTIVIDSSGNATVSYVKLNYSSTYTYNETTTYAYTEDTSIEISEITFTNEYKTTEVTVTKLWNDNSQNHDNDEITVNLMDGTTVVDTVTLNSGNSWTYTFIDLDKYDADGNAIDYTIEEVNVEGYNSVISGNATDGYTITNTEATSVSVEKVWNDNGQNHDNDEITVNLMNGTTVVDTATLSSENSWTYTFTNLDKYDSDGNAIDYTIDEVDVEGYNSVITGNATDGYAITNTEATSVSIEKVWNDNNDAYETRLESITVVLYANGTSVVDTVTFTGTDSTWTYTFTDLDKYDSNGNPISYTVREVIVNADGTKTVASSISGNNNSTYIVSNEDSDGKTIITNTLTGTTELTVTKVWDIDSDDEFINELSIPVTLTGTAVDYTETYSYTLTETDEDSYENWVYTFENLPLYTSDGNPITYTIAEDDVDATSLLVEHDGHTFYVSYDQDEYTITNTYPATSITLEGNKTLDGENASGYTFYLYELDDNDEIIESSVLTATSDENGNISFTIPYTYKDAGTYKYMMVEANQGEIIDGISYSSEAYIITVTVTYSEGVLDDPTYEISNANGETVNEITFNNTTLEEPVKDVVDSEETSINEETVQVGDILTYVIEYTNDTANEQSVVIKDEAPAGTTYVGNETAKVDGVDSADVDIDPVDGKVTWTLDTLAAGSTITVSFQVEVTSEALDLDNNTVVNTATVTINNEYDLETNEVTNDVPEEPVKDVVDSEGTSINEETVQVGDILTYVIE